MDLYKAIRSLYEEKKRLDRLIDSLERLPAGGTGPPAAKPNRRRGRRRMNSEERNAVSARMKRYWETRRGQDAAGAGVREAAPTADPAP